VRFNKDRNKAVCTTCLRFKEVAMRDVLDRPYCPACRIRYHRVIHCVRCKRDKPFGKHTQEGDICGVCYGREYRRRKQADNH